MHLLKKNFLLETPAGPPPWRIKIKNEKDEEKEGKRKKKERKEKTLASRHRASRIPRAPIVRTSAACSQKKVSSKLIQKRGVGEERGAGRRLTATSIIITRIAPIIRILLVIASIIPLALQAQNRPKPRQPGPQTQSFFPPATTATMSAIIAVSAPSGLRRTVPCPPTACSGSTSAVAAPATMGMVGMAFVLVDLVGSSSTLVAAAAEDGPEAAETAVEDEEAEEEEAGEDADDDSRDFAAGEAAAAAGLVFREGDVGARGDGGDEGDSSGGAGGFGDLD